MQCADRSNLIILTPADDTRAVFRPLCRVMLLYAMLNCFFPLMFTCCIFIFLFFGVCFFCFVFCLFVCFVFYHSEAQCSRAMAVLFGVICGITLIKT